MTPELKPETFSNGLVTVAIAGRYFGVPLARVTHVFVPDRLSPVPLAPADIAGLTNRRGRIVTALDLRVRLGLPMRPPGAPMIAVGVEQGGELYGLIADEAFEAMWTAPSDLKPAPANLDARWAGLSAGLCRLNDGLLTVLDVDRVLDLNHCGIAA